MATMHRAGRFIAALIVAGLTGCGGGQQQVKPPEPVKAVRIEGPKLRIAVVDFENKTAYGQRLGTAAADILVTELARTDRFIMIERAKLEKILQEQKLGLSGAINPDTAAQMGKVLGAAAIVSGAVSEYGTKSAGTDLLITESKRQIAECVVDVRIIDAETSQILYAESGRGKAESSTGSFLGLGTKSSYDEALEGRSLRSAIEGFAANVVAKLSALNWSCRVADVDGQTIYLDAGERSGLPVGSVLEVVRLGAEIKSPSTGLVIGRKESKLGRAKVEKHFGEDGAEARMLEGSPPTRGDLCRMLKGENQGF